MEAVALVPLILFWIALPIGAIWLAARFVRAYMERTKVLSSGGDTGAGHARVEALESQIELMRSEIDRLQEAQQFTNQLLAQRNPKLPPSDVSRAE